jgi:hypothetical protein
VPLDMDVDCGWLCWSESDTRRGLDRKARLLAATVAENMFTDFCWIRAAKLMEKDGNKG